MNRKRLKLLWSFLKGKKGLLTGAIISVVLAVASRFISPLIIAVVLDSVIGDKPLNLPSQLVNIINDLGGVEMLRQNLWICGVALVAVMAIRGIFLFTRGRWVAIASEKMAMDIRNKLYNHLQRLPYDYHVKAETGDIIQRCTSDVEMTRRFIATQFIEIVRMLTMLVIALVVLFNMHAGLTLISLVLVPITIVLSTWFFKKVQKMFKKVEEAEGRLSTILQENLTGIRVVRAFGRQKYEREKYTEANRDFRDKNMGLMKYFSLFYGGTDLLVMGQTMVALIGGIILAVRGTITLGEFTVFNTYIQMLMWPVRHFGRVLADMGKMLIAVGRIGDILSEEEETSGENPVSPELNGDIKFEDVTFSYDEKSNPVLKNLSFNVKAGETVAILGATGSGKSSLVQLLQRLYDHQQGTISIGGIDIKTIEKHHLRSRIGIVLQEPFLYSKTIKENIGITLVNQNDNMIYNAAQIASVHDVINEFENGYDTVVGERGVTLSGGQKQRVAIARTILRDSDVLIFDDSLSAVDTQTDAKIRTALKERRKGVTTFIISHRISTLMEADRILVLEDGHIVQQGKHEELANQEGLYKRIWNIQTAREEAEEVAV
jgi:ATP-binding cassette subfamily B protein